ncbi:serine-rich adhesin for platelets-like [Macrobrachium rosenbergii]|uniref:serine-rich adhesin for platelets-like n=1 Tax=Macrobrachium rosenbergii TaxID=79674 RepID=UPI0034D6E24B
MKKSSPWPSAGDATEEDALKDKMELERQSSDESIPPIHQCPSVEEKKKEKEQQLRNLFRSNKVGVGDEVQEVWEVPRGNVPPSATFRSSSGRSEFQEVEFTEAKIDAEGRVGLAPGYYEGEQQKPNVMKAVANGMRVFGSCNPGESSDDEGCAKPKEDITIEEVDGDDEGDGNGGGDAEGEGNGGDEGDDGGKGDDEGENEGADGDSDSTSESDNSDGSDKDDDEEDDSYPEDGETKTKQDPENSASITGKADEAVDSTGVRVIREQSAIKRGTGSIGNVAVVSRFISGPKVSYNNYNRPSTSEHARYNSGASTSKAGYYKGQGPSRDSSFTDATDLTSGSAREDTTLTIEEEGEEEEEHKPMDPVQLRKAQMKVAKPFLTASSLAIYSQIHQNGVSKLGTWVLGTSLVCTFVVTIVLTVLILIAPKTLSPKLHVDYTTEAPTVVPDNALITGPALPAGALVWKDVSIDLEISPISFEKTNASLTVSNSTGALTSSIKNNRKSLRTSHVGNPNVQRVVFRKGYEISQKSPSQPSSSNKSVLKTSGKMFNTVPYNSSTSQLPFVNQETSSIVYPSSRNLSVLSSVNNTDNIVKYSKNSSDLYLHGVITESTARTNVIHTLLSQRVNTPGKTRTHSYTAQTPPINITTVRSSSILHTSSLYNKTTSQPLKGGTGVPNKQKYKEENSAFHDIVTSKQSLDNATAKERLGRFHEMFSDNNTTNQSLMHSVTVMQDIILNTTATYVSVSPPHFHSPKKSPSVQNTTNQLKTETRLNSTIEHVFIKGTIMIDKEEVTPQTDLSLPFTESVTEISNSMFHKESKVDVVKNSRDDGLGDTSVGKLMKNSHGKANILTLKPDIMKTDGYRDIAIAFNTTKSQLLLDMSANITVESSHGNESKLYESGEKAKYNGTNSETGPLHLLNSTGELRFLVSNYKKRDHIILEGTKAPTDIGKTKNYSLMVEAKTHNISEKLENRNDTVAAKSMTKKNEDPININSSKRINSPSSTETLKSNGSHNVTYKSEIPRSKKEKEVESDFDKSGIINITWVNDTLLSLDESEAHSDMNKSEVLISSEGTKSSDSNETTSDRNESKDIKRSGNFETQGMMDRTETLSSEQSETLTSTDEPETQSGVKDTDGIRNNGNGESKVTADNTNRPPVESNGEKVFNPDWDEMTTNVTTDITNSSYFIS